MLEKRLLTGNEVDIVFIIDRHPYPDIFEINTEYVSKNRFRLKVTRKDKDTGWGVNLGLTGYLPGNKYIKIKVGTSSTNQKILENNVQTDIQRIKKNTKGSISKRVFQIHRDVPDYLELQSSSSWKQLHCDHEYYLCEENKKDPLQKFNLIYTYGGIFCQSPHICKSVISKAIQPNKSGLVIHLGNRKSFRNDFFIFSRGHPLLRDFIQKIGNSKNSENIEKIWNETILQYLKSKKGAIQVMENNRFVKRSVSVISNQQLQLIQNKFESNANSNTVKKPTQVKEEVEEAEEVEETEEVEEAEEEVLEPVSDESPQTNITTDVSSENTEVEIIEVEIEVDENGNEISEQSFTEKNAMHELQEVITDNPSDHQSSNHPEISC